MKKLLLLLATSAFHPLCLAEDVEIRFEPAEGYVAGPVHGQAAGDARKWAETKPNLSVSSIVAEGGNPGGYLKIEHPPGEDYNYQGVRLDTLDATKEQADLPTAPVKFSIDLRLDSMNSQSTEGVVFGISLFRDASGENTGRGLRLSILLNGTVQVIGSEKPAAEVFSSTTDWVTLKGEVNFQAQTATVSANDVPLADGMEVPFAGVSGTGSDEVGFLEVNTGPLENHTLSVDNIVFNFSEQ